MTDPAVIPPFPDTSYLSPAFFDSPGDQRPRKIFRAWGSKLVSQPGKKKKWRHSWVHINAPAIAIAQRTAKRHFNLYRETLDSVTEISWSEYAEGFRNCGGGIKIEGLQP